MARYRLRELMDARGMSTNDLRQRSGVSATTLTDMLMGRREAMPETLDRLADALGVKPEELIEHGAGVNVAGQ